MGLGLTTYHYEIRLVRKESGATIHVTTQPSDALAIERAEALASELDAVEVWRGKKCIFRKDVAAPLA